MRNLREPSFEALLLLQVGQNAYWGGNSQQETESAVQAGMTAAAQAWWEQGVTRQG